MPRYLTYSIFFLLLAANIGCSSLKLNGPEAEALPPALPKAEMSIHLGLEIPLSFLQKKINESLQQQLFQENGLELGNGLFADVDLQKNGRLSLAATEEGKLLVGLPVFLDGKVRLEKRIFGQKISSAIPFQETLSPQISFLPQINSDWTFGIEELDILSWGKSLQYDLLGFNIDFEPLVKKKMISIMEDQLLSGSLKSLDFKTIADDFWSTFGKPRYIENGLSNTYLYTRPEKLAIYDEFTRDQMLLLNIGLEGEMLRQKDRPLATQIAPLPPVSREKVEGNEFSITLPIFIGFEEMADYLNQLLSDSLIMVDKQTRLLPQKFTLRQFGERTLVTMDFIGKRTGKKDINGTFYLAGKPVYDAPSKAIVLDNVDFKLVTKNFFANTSNWMKRRKVLKAIQKRAVFPIGEYLGEARSALQKEGQLNINLFALSLQSPEIFIDGIFPSTTGLNVYVRTAAGIATQWKP
jgi:hypothetical protein